jgi:rhodanese-related sulfurtransferase
MICRSQLVAVALSALSMLSGACALFTAPRTIEQGTAPGGVASDSDLDAAVSAFLAGMEDYNVLRLTTLVEMLNQDPVPFLLDVREPSEVERSGHIPGAVVIPLRELTDHLDLLPAFDRTIVSYCGSGWRCTIAMTALGTLGWQEVLSLQDGSFGGYLDGGYEVAPGLPEPSAPLDAAQPDPALVLAVDGMLGGLPRGWGAITAADLAAELDDNPELVLIDVRTQAEIDLSGSIGGDNTRVIPIEQLVARRAEWPRDRDLPVVVYSGSGHRGGMAMTILRIYGYTDVRSLAGGTGAWVAAGYSLVGAGGP